MSKFSDKKAQELWDNMNNPDFIDNYVGERDKKDKKVYNNDASDKDLKEIKEGLRILSNILQSKYDMSIKMMEEYGRNDKYFKANTYKCASEIYKDLNYRIQSLLVTNSPIINSDIENILNLIGADFDN